MAEEQAAHHLLNVLEERGLHVDLDKILLGFEDEQIKAEAAIWVEEYLQDDTLLTKEELELYQTLKKKGLLHQYETEDESTRPLLDHELASAIESLQSSTAAIEEQCKVLETQKVALLKLKALDKPNMDVEHARNERRRKEGQEKARLDVAIEDVSTSINDQLAETQKELATDKATLSSYLSERMSSDDLILSRLPGIVSQIVTELEDNQDGKAVEQWCKAIVSYRTNEIKARVDAVFLESLAKGTANGSSDGNDEDRKTALQAEMKELHSEIASVAEMVVEHEFRKPLKEMKERKDREVVQARGAWLNYVMSTLEYMGKRLDTIATSTHDAEGLQHAIAHVAEAAAKRMPEPPTARPTPSRRGTTSAASLAFTPMVKLKPNQRLNLPVALQDALRQAGVQFNQDSLEGLQDSMAHTQAERERKLMDHYRSTSTQTHERLAERASRADSDLGVILDALYKHTLFQQVQLNDATVEGQLKSIERELERKDHDLVEAEGSELSVSDPKVRAFIAKYGR